MKNALFVKLISVGILLTSQAYSSPYDTPKLKAIRNFISSSVGVHSLKGEEACKKIEISLRGPSVSDKYYQLIGVALGIYPSSWAGGTYLYHSSYRQENLCNFIQPNVLQCTLNHSVNSGALGSTSVVTKFQMTKDRSGQLIGFSIVQNQLPPLNLNCHL
jgi:hypothetical protein